MGVDILSFTNGLSLDLKLRTRLYNKSQVVRHDAHRVLEVELKKAKGD